MANNAIFRKINPNCKMKTYYSVSPSAEKVCDTVATIFLVISILAAVIFIIAGVLVDADTLVVGLVGAAACIVVGLISWASLKVVVNMSRSLYNITAALQELQAKLGQSEN